MARKITIAGFKKKLPTPKKRQNDYPHDNKTADQGYQNKKHFDSHIILSNYLLRYYQACVLKAGAHIAEYLPTILFASYYAWGSKIY